MGNTTLTAKLRMQPGQRVLIMNAPSGYVEVLDPLPVGFLSQAQLENGDRPEPRRGLGDCG